MLSHTFKSDQALFEQNKMECFESGDIAILCVDYQYAEKFAKSYMNSFKIIFLAVVDCKCIIYDRKLEEVQGYKYYSINIINYYIQIIIHHH